MSSRFIRRVLLLGMLAVWLAGACPVLAEGHNGKGQPVEVELRKQPPERVQGELVRWDEGGIVLKSGEDEREIPWLDMTAMSAFRLRQRLIDRTKPDQLFAAGEMGRAMGIDRPAAQLIEQAVKRDPTLRERADLILQKKPGWGLQAPPSTPPEAMMPSPDGEPPPVVYRETTPEEDARAIELARARTREVEQKLQIKLAEFQTPHFIVFTDWHPREYGFLEKNLEGAYRAVANVFDEDPKENVFEGKLAIYMFNTQADFARFASQFGQIPQVPDDMAGYFGWQGTIIHMAMWKPDLRKPGVTREMAEYQWAYVLAHEFVHAFTFRYRTSRMPPLWVNEGLAEAVSMKMFPMMSDWSKARDELARMPSLKEFFQDEPSQRRFDAYPVNRALIETLLAKDRKAFIKWFDALKAGEDLEAALKTHYKWTLEDLERYTRRYVEMVSRRGR